MHQYTAATHVQTYPPLSNGGIAGPLYQSIMDNYFKSCFDAPDTLLLLTDIVHNAVLQCHAKCRDSSHFCSRLARLRNSACLLSYHP